MIRPPVLAAFIIAFSGCAAMKEELKLDPGAEKVRLLMSEQRDCKFISEITVTYVAKERWEETDEKARILLRNEALAKKANAVTIIAIDRRKENPESGFDEPASTKILGNAYHCYRLDNR